MKQYDYFILGEYKDWIKFYKGHEIIHDGTLLGMVEKDDDEILLRLNYGTENYYYSTLKNMNGFKLSVPTEPDLLQEEYKYLPIIFNQGEFEEFVGTIYTNEELSKDIQKIKTSDLINIWLMSNPNRDSYTSVTEMKNTMLNNILFFSEEEYDTSQLTHMLETFEFSISRIPEKNDSITIYIGDSKGRIHQWNGLVKIDSQVYIKLNDAYYLDYKKE